MQKFVRVTLHSVASLMLFGAFVEISTGAWVLPNNVWRVCYASICFCAAAWHMGCSRRAIRDNTTPKLNQT
jgi:hypothetical protein